MDYGLSPIKRPWLLGPGRGDDRESMIAGTVSRATPTSASPDERHRSAASLEPQPPSVGDASADAPRVSGLFWDHARSAFYGALLDEAMLARELVPDTLAQAAGVSLATVYSALSGHPVRRTTALKILRALSDREVRLRPALSGWHRH